MTRSELGLTIIAIIAAGASVNFFILGTAGAVPFLEYRNYVLIPSFFVILFIAIYGYKRHRRLANRLARGLLIGLVATLALEAVRIPSISVHWIPHDDMIAFPGMLLTKTPTATEFKSMMGGGHSDNITPSVTSDKMKTSGDNEHGNNSMHDQMTDSMSSSSKNNPEQPATQTASPSNSVLGDKHNDVMMQDSMQPSASDLVVGGLYHFWNGATMGAVYTLVVGKGRWWYGLIWGFIIDVGMMLAPWMLPMVGPFGINYGTGYTIFTASLFAHLAYGFVIGILAQRFVQEKNSLISLYRSK
jgi:hypothetical protein